MGKKLIFSSINQFICRIFRYKEGKIVVLLKIPKIARLRSIIGSTDGGCCSSGMIAAKSDRP